MKDPILNDEEMNLSPMKTVKVENENMTDNSFTGALTSNKKPPGQNEEKPPIDDKDQNLNNNPSDDVLHPNNKNFIEKSLVQFKENNSNESSVKTKKKPTNCSFNWFRCCGSSSAPKKNTNPGEQAQGEVQNAKENAKSTNGGANPKEGTVAVKPPPKVLCFGPCCSRFITFVKDKTLYLFKCECFGVVSKDVAQRAKQLDLPYFIKLEKASPNFCRVYIEGIDRIGKQIENFEMEESSVDIKKAIQWHKHHEFFVELSHKADPQKFVESFKQLMLAFKFQVLSKPETIENVFLAEMTRQNLNILFSFMTESPNQKIEITEADKNLWKVIQVEIKKAVEEKKDIPTNILYQNVEMMERGIRLLKTEKNEIGDAFGKLFAGGVKLWSTGNPLDLLSGLKSLVLAVGKDMVSDKLAQVFILSYHMDKLARWYMLQSFKLNKDILLEKEGGNQQIKPISLKREEVNTATEEDLENLNKKEEKTTNEVITEIKATLCTFEKDIVKHVKSPFIGYHWVKLLNDMIMCDRSILPNSDQEKIMMQCNLKSKIDNTKGQLIQLGWIMSIHKDYYIVNTTIAGRPKGLTNPEFVQLKKKFIGMRFTYETSVELQEFLYFGEPDKFTGLKEYIAFGADYENSLASRLGDFASSILTNVSANQKLSESIFTNLSSTAQIETHIKIIFDTALKSILDECKNNMTELKDYLLKGGLFDNLYGNYLNEIESSKNELLALDKKKK